MPSAAPTYGCGYSRPIIAIVLRPIIANLFLSSHCSSSQPVLCFPYSKYTNTNTWLNIKILQSILRTFISKSFDNGTLMHIVPQPKLKSWSKNRIVATAETAKGGMAKRKSGIPQCVRSVPDDAAAAGVLEHAVIHGEHTVHHHIGDAVGRGVRLAPLSGILALSRTASRSKAQGPRHIPAPARPCRECGMFGRAAACICTRLPPAPAGALFPHHLTQKTRIAARNLRVPLAGGVARPRPYSSWHRAFAAPRRSRTARRNSR